MTKNQDLPQTVPAGPTKQFFVSMLTRDIALEDALLDLLDNCIDGILRTQKPNITTHKPYEGRWAHLTLSPNKFVIEDNCGGIPLKIAKDSAFMMGRLTGIATERIQTVGVYGIGMKRAIFKLGRNCVVSSNAVESKFEVRIPTKWFTAENDWDLPLSAATRPLLQAGTRIEVTDLNPEVREKFSREDAFLENFRKILAQHYNIILNKGFTVTVNEKAIKPAVVKFLSIDDLSKDGIAPYLFQGRISEVDVEIVAGFYRISPGEKELEDEATSPRSTDEAGWTLICNDRVVLAQDKTILTGWGEAGVPRYHNQFIGIAGIVHFRCKDTAKLPLTTTKRGIEASSPVFLQAKNKMREGLKRFTSMTNQYKKHPEGREKLFAATKAYTLDDLVELRRTAKFVTDRGISNSKEYLPTLPAPKESTEKTIRFMRPDKLIKKVAKKLFDDPDIAPNKVGEACFDRILQG